TISTWSATRASLFIVRLKSRLNCQRKRKLWSPTRFGFQVRHARLWRAHVQMMARQRRAYRSFRDRVDPGDVREVNLLRIHGQIPDPSAFSPIEFHRISTALRDFHQRHRTKRTFTRHVVKVVDVLAVGNKVHYVIYRSIKLRRLSALLAEF